MSVILLLFALLIRTSDVVESSKITIYFTKLYSITRSTSSIIRFNWKFVHRSMFGKTVLLSTFWSESIFNDDGWDVQNWCFDSNYSEYLKLLIWKLKFLVFYLKRGFLSFRLNCTRRPVTIATVILPGTVICAMTLISRDNLKQYLVLFFKISYLIETYRKKMFDAKNVHSFMHHIDDLLRWYVDLLITLNAL